MKSWIFLLLLISGCSFLPAQNETKTLPYIAQGHTISDEVSHGTVIRQLRKFFTEHPEYIYSKTENECLYVHFLYVLNNPEYRNLNMYDALTIAHQKVILNNRIKHSCVD